MNLTEMTIQEIELLKPNVFYIRIPFPENFILMPVKVLSNNTLSNWDFEDSKFLEDYTESFEGLKDLLKNGPDIYKLYVEDSPC